MFVENLIDMVVVLTVGGGTFLGVAALVRLFINLFGKGGAE